MLVLSGSSDYLDKKIHPTFRGRGTKVCFEIHNDFRWRPNNLIKIFSRKIKIVGSDQKIISTQLEVVACMFMFHGNIYALTKLHDYSLKMKKLYITSYIPRNKLNMTDYMWQQ